MSGSEKPDFNYALAVGRALDLTLPDSHAVREAYAQAKAESSPWLFNHVARTCLCGIAKNHPNTTKDNFIADFGLKYVPGYTRASSVDFLHQAPFAE